MKLKLIIKKHYWVFIMAIIIGLLVLSLQLIFQAALSENFQGIYRQINNDELYYMARAQDIVDGHYLLSNPFLAEYKAGLPMQVFLPDLLLALPAKILNIGVYPLFAFYDFLLPAILFVLGYFIFYFLIRNQFWSLFFSSWMFLIKYFMLFNRSISPQFNFIFILTIVLLLLHGLTAEKNNKAIIVLVAINFGWLFYSYPYFWTYITALLVLTGLVFLWRKDFALVKRIAVIFISGLVLASGYFYQAWRASQFEFFQETIRRLGLIDTHFPSGIKTLVPAAIILLAYLFYWLKNKKSLTNVGYFLLAGVVTAVVCTNQHIITGVNQFFAGHYQMISYFFMTFAAVYLLWQNKMIAKILNSNLLKAIFIIIFIIFFAPNYLRATQFEYETELSIQRFAPVFDWLNKNTDKDSVIMANSEKLTDYVPSYTHNNIFFNGPAGLFFISNQELIDRFAILNYWRADIDNYVRNNFKAVYGLQARALGGHYEQRNKLKKIFGRPETALEDIYYPPEKIATILNHLKVMSEDDWVAAFKRYKIDYLVLDNSLNADWSLNPKKYDWLKLEQTVSGMSIYRIVPSPAVSENEQNNDLLSFVAISHIHKSLTNPLSNAFTTAVDKINDLRPDFVMFLGDYIWGFDNFIADWEKFNRIADKIQTEKFMIAGNHDITSQPADKTVSDLSKLEYYKKNVGDLYYSFERAGNLFIALNSFNSGDLRDNFDSAQLDFLRAKLKDSSKYKNVFVFTHQCSWLESNNNWHSAVMPIINGRVDYVMCGTKSTPYYAKADGITYVMGGMSYKQVYGKSFFIQVVISMEGQVEMFPVLINDGNFLELADFYLDENVNQGPIVYNYNWVVSWINDHTKLITVGVMGVFFLAGIFIGYKK